MTNEKIVAAIKQAREKAPKRKFRQSFDLAVNFKNLDTKKAEGKIKTEVVLPHPSESGKVGIFVDALVPAAKKLGETVVIITKDQLETYSANKKAAKSLANSAAGFLAEAPLMPAVAKALGPVLAVRGKMPKPIPPTIQDLAGAVSRTRATVRLAVRDSPVVQARIGTEEMSDGEVGANIEAVIAAVTAALPKGRDQIKNGVVKLTMGPAVKFEVS